MSRPMTLISISLRCDNTGADGPHDNYGFALAAHPGKSRGRPDNNTSSQLIGHVGLPVACAPGTLILAWPGCFDSLAAQGDEDADLHMPDNNALELAYSMHGCQRARIFMQTRMLGRLWPVSALTLGGGGIGQLWGATTREECVATVRAAVERGVTLLDMAPAYGNGEAESVVGAAFEGQLPTGVRVTTKHRLGTPPAGEVERNILRSLEESLTRMRL